MRLALAAGLLLAAASVAPQWNRLLPAARRPASCRQPADPPAAGSPPTLTLTP
ncbi:MAG: hypothetical protein WD072_13020 [Pirellulales bacterium]